MAPQTFVPEFWTEDWVFDDFGVLCTAMAAFPDDDARSPRQPVVAIRVTARLAEDMRGRFVRAGATSVGPTVDDAADSDLTGPADTFSLGLARFNKLFDRIPGTQTGALPPDMVSAVAPPGVSQKLRVRVTPSGAQGASLRPIGELLVCGRMLGDFVGGVISNGAVDADALWRASATVPPVDQMDPLWFGPRRPDGTPKYVSHRGCRPGGRLWGELQRFLGDTRPVMAVCEAEHCVLLKPGATVVPCDAGALVGLDDGGTAMATAEWEWEERRPLVAWQYGARCTASADKDVFELATSGERKLIRSADGTYRQVGYGGHSEVGTAGVVVAARYMNGHILALECVKADSETRLAARLYTEYLPPVDVITLVHNGTVWLSRLPDSPINRGWPRLVRGLVAQQWLRSADDTTTVVVMLFDGTDARRATLVDVTRTIASNIGSNFFVFHDKYLPNAVVDAAGWPDADATRTGTLRVPVDALINTPVPLGALSIVVTDAMSDFRNIIESMCVEQRTDTEMGESTLDRGTQDGQFNGIEAYRRARPDARPALRFCADAIPQTWFTGPLWMR